MAVQALLLQRMAPFVDQNSEDQGNNKIGRFKALTFDYSNDPMEAGD